MTIHLLYGVIGIIHLCLVVESKQVQPISEFGCECSVCGDPQLTACNQTTSHISMENTNKQGQIELMDVYLGYSVSMKMFVQLSHVAGAPPNHIQKDYLGVHIQTTRGNKNVAYLINSTGLYTAKLYKADSLKSLELIKPNEPLGKVASTYMDLLKNNPDHDCYEFNIKRSTELHDVGVRYCDGCITTYAAKDLFRNGVCQDIQYHASPVHRGCYTYRSSERLMKNFGVKLFAFKKDMTIERCTGHCWQKGYAYAGLQDSSNCLCGAASYYFTISGPSNDCNSACSGNGSQTCGGSRSVDVYRTLDIGYAMGDDIISGRQHYI